MQGDDVGARKGLVVEQVLPHLGLDVHALDGIPREDIGVAAVPDRDNVRVVGEDLVGDGVDEIAFTVAQAGAQRVGLCIAREDEADEVLLLQGLGVDRVLVRVLLEPGGDDLDVEDCAVGGADRVLERLEGGGAEVEGEAAEGDLGGVGAGGVGADVGGEGVCGGPFGVGDLGGGGRRDGSQYSSWTGLWC